METSSTATSEADLIRDFPDLTFWYGLGYADLCAMPRFVIDVYVEALPRVLASAQLRALQAATYPHMKKEDAQALYASLRADAQAGERARRPQNAEELRDVASALGIEVMV